MTQSWAGGAWEQGYVYTANDQAMKAVKEPTEGKSKITTNFHVHMLNKW